MAPDEEIPDETVDVDQLMSDLRLRVAEKKARGLYSVDALLTEPPAAEEPFGAEELEDIRQKAVLHYELAVNPSTKPVVGTVFTQAKRALVRGTSQPGFALARQANAFHASLLAYLARVARELREIRDEVGELRREVARLEEAAREGEVERQRDLGQLEGRVEELAARLEETRAARPEAASEPRE